MGKVNIRAKAKKALAKAAEEVNKKEHKLSTNLKAKSKRQKGEDNKKLLLQTSIASTTSNADGRKVIGSKREKLKQKRKNLMQKFALIRKQQKEEKAKENRQKTAVVGDLKPLKDALPSLDELFALSKEKAGDLKTGIKGQDNTDDGLTKLSVRQKLKKKKETFVSKVEKFQALLKDPDFKKNPRDAIAYHIKYTHGLIEE